MPARFPIESARSEIDVLRDVAFPWLAPTAERGWFPTQAVSNEFDEVVPSYELHDSPVTLRRIQAALEGWARVRQAAGPRPNWAELDLSWAINHALGALPASRSIRSASLRPWVALYDDEFVDLVTPTDEYFAPRIQAQSLCGTGVMPDRQTYQRAADHRTRLAAAQSHEVAYRTLDPDVAPGVLPEHGALDLAAELPSLNRRPGTIVLPAGTWFVDQPISLYAGQTIRGSGSTTLVFRTPQAHIRVNRVPAGAAPWDILPEPLGQDGPRGLGRAFTSVFVSGAPLAGGGLEQDDAVLNNPANWKAKGLLRTNVVIENLILVDARPMAATGPPLLDALNGAWFRLRHLVLRGAGGRTGIRTGRYDLGTNDTDTSPYYCRIEQCDFSDFETAIEVMQGSLLQIAGCRFSTTEGQTGVRAINLGYVCVDGCLFESPPGAAPGRGIHLDGLPTTTYDQCLPTEENRNCDRQCLDTAEMYCVASSMAMFGRAEFCDNRFEGVAQPVAVSTIPDKLGMMFSMNGSVVEPATPGGARPTLVSPTRELTGLHLADGLVGILGRVDRIVVNSGAGTPDAGPPRFSSPNLLIGGSLAAQDRLERGEATISSLDEWWYRATIPNESRGRSVRVPIQRIGAGPAGRGFDPAVRLSIERIAPPGLRPGDLLLRIMRFVVPPLLTDAPNVELSDLRARRRMASRALGERPFNASCWVRTNVRPLAGVSGVNVQLLYAPLKGAVAMTAFLTSTLHPGDSHWALLTGSGAANGHSHPLVGADRPADSAIYMAITVKLPAQPDDHGKGPVAHFVDICTPYVGTGAYGTVPRTAWLTEAGGHVTGCLEVVPRSAMQSTGLDG